MAENLEFKICIKDTPQNYIDGLILGLVHSGYSAYMDFDNEHVCFNGFADDVITQKIEVIK